MMNRSLTLVVGFAGALWVLSGCGGDDKPKAGTMCIQNSDCNNPLSCTGGKCHNQCKESRDCPGGARCVKDNMNQLVCLLPEETKCALNSQCNPPPLVCAKDLQCRNQCAEDRDCGKGQKCIEKACAEMNEYDPVTMMLHPPVANDGGAAGTGGGGTGGGAGGAGGTAGAVGDGGISDGGNAGTGGVTDGPSPDVPNVPITVEVVADKPSVRQGDLVTLTVTGPNVSSPAGFDAGGFTVALQPGGTMTMFKASIAVPHGAPVGPKDFKFTTAAGIGEKKAAFTVSAITAGPMGDDNNRGTSDNPFKTFTKALTVSAAGDTVSLLDGEYNAGETWMKAIPDKVTLVGTSTAGTVIKGPGAMGGGTSAQGLFFAGDATVRNLTVSFFTSYNIYVDKPGTILLENVVSTGGRSDGLYVAAGAMGAKITITGAMSDFGGNTQSAIQVANATGLQLTVSGGAKLSSMTTYVLYVSSGSKANITLDDVTISSMSTYGIYVYGMDNTLTLKKATLSRPVQFTSPGPMNSGTLDIVDSNITVTMNEYPVQFSGSTLNITGTTITGGYDQVAQNYGAAKVRGSKFKDYRRHGYTIHVGTLDMGTGTDPGTNEFTGPDMPYIYGLYDGRNLAQIPINVSFTTFNGLRPSAGLVEHTMATPVVVPGKYAIRTYGNKIEFH